MTSPDLDAAGRGLGLAWERLVALNASDVGTGEGRGPSFVGDPVPLPGGFLWSLDTSGMPRRELAGLLDIVVDALVEAGVDDAVIGLPQKVDYSPFRALTLSPGVAMSVVAHGVADWTDVRSAARPEAWGPLLDVGLGWLLDGGGDEPPLVAVIGGGGPYGLDVPPDGLAAALGGALAAGGGLALLRRSEDGVRYARLSAILRPFLSATWFPNEQSVAGLAAVATLTGRLEEVADRLTWAAADVQPGDGESKELIGHNAAPMIPGELPRNGHFLMARRDDQIPGAFPWQILNPERRARLGAVVPGADEESLAGGRCVLRFGSTADWLPGPGRTAMRDAARRAFGPAFD